MTDDVASAPTNEADILMWCTSCPTEAAAEIVALRERAERAEFVLSDPAAFHLHALRNNVLSRMNALHIAGATDYDSLKARADAMQERCTKHSSELSGRKASN